MRRELYSNSKCDAAPPTVGRIEEMLFTVEEIQSMQSIETQKLLDRMAIAASALCAVHCLATPLLVVLVPLLTSTLLADESFHRWMLLWVVPTSALALWLGCRRHGNRPVLILGLAGLTLITWSAFWAHELVGEFGERVATVAGGLTIVAGHWRNYRLCRKDDCAH